MKTILIVGHCGYDAPRLRQIVEKIPDTQAIIVNDQQQLSQYLEQKKEADLALINRIGSSDGHSGIEIIKQLTQTNPQLKTMLISNYADAQQQAIEAGALLGFGKDSLESPQTQQRIQQALAGETS